MPIFSTEISGIFQNFFEIFFEVFFKILNYSQKYIAPNKYFGYFIYSFKQTHGLYWF